MIKSSIVNGKGFSHFYASDFHGFENVESRESFSLTLWPEGRNSSAEPDACAMVSIESDRLDGETPEEFSVLLDKPALLALRDMLNERFPI